MKLADIMTRDPMIIDPRESVGSAFHLMTVRGIRHLPVVERGRLIGIVTDRDLRAYAASPEVLVGWIMTANPVTAKVNDDARVVAQTMADQKIGCLPIVDDAGNIVGIVTAIDFLSGFTRTVDPQPPVS